MWTRTAEVLAMSMIGDGVVSVVQPRRHVLRWLVGPAVQRRWFGYFAARPGLTRVAGAAEAALGLWWASRLPARPR